MLSVYSTCLCHRTGKLVLRVNERVVSFIGRILLGMTLSRVFGTCHATGMAKRLHLSVILVVVVRFSLDTVIRKVGDVVTS